MMLLFSDMMYMLMRYASPSGPMCLRCLMLTLSGPDVDFIRSCGVVVLFCFIATRTCVVVSVMLGVCSLSVPIYVSVVLRVLCLTVLVNCLLNAFAICVGEMSVFSLKVMVLFWGCVGVLLASPCIVFQIVCVLCL